MFCSYTIFVNVAGLEICTSKRYFSVGFILSQISYTDLCSLERKYVQKTAHSLSGLGEVNFYAGIVPYQKFVCPNIQCLVMDG